MRRTVSLLAAPGISSSSRIGSLTSRNVERFAALKYSCSSSTKAHRRPLGSACSGGIRKLRATTKMRDHLLFHRIDLAARPRRPRRQDSRRRGTRVTQRLLAMAAGIWHNWTTGVTSKRSLTAR
jgi:hypothetical protein